MKYFLLAIILLGAGGCTKRSENKPTPPPQEHILEGTVVKFYRLLVPEAHATNFAVLLSGSSDNRCGDADRCAFLIDASGKEELLITTTPVRQGKFKFSLSQPLSPEKIYKVVVRGWDPIKKEPIVGKADREIAFKGQEISGAVEITPETTLSSRVRVEVLKSNKSGEVRAIIDDLLKKISEWFDLTAGALRQKLVSLLDDMKEDLSDLMKALLEGDDLERIRAEAELRSIRSSLAPMSVNNLSPADTLLLLDRVNESLLHVFQGRFLISDRDHLKSYILDNHMIVEGLDYSEEKEVINDLLAELRVEELEENKLNLSSHILDLEEDLNLLMESQEGLRIQIKDACRNFLKYEELWQVGQELSEFKRFLDINQDKYQPIRDQLIMKLREINPVSGDLLEEDREAMKRVCLQREVS